MDGQTKRRSGRFQYTPPPPPTLLQGGGGDTETVHHLHLRRDDASEQEHVSVKELLSGINKWLDQKNCLKIQKKSKKQQNSSIRNNTHCCWFDQHVNNVERLCEGNPAVPKLLGPSIVEEDAEILVKRTQVRQEASAQQHIAYQSAKRKRFRVKESRRNKMVKAHKCFQSQCHGTSWWVKIPWVLPKGRLLQVADLSSVNSRVISRDLVYEIIEHLFMIKICVTLNEIACSQRKTTTKNPQEQ